MGIDLTEQEIQELLKDPVAWMNGEEEKKLARREDAQNNFHRTLEDIHNFHYMRMVNAYKHLVKAGKIEEGDDPPWGKQEKPEVVY